MEGIFGVPAEGESFGGGVADHDGTGVVANKALSADDDVERDEVAVDRKSTRLNSSHARS
jgi:hypothetical protein